MSKNKLQIGAYGIPIEIEFLYHDDHSDWKSYVWRVNIGSQYFEYRTGLGHATDITPGSFRNPPKGLTLSNAIQGKRLHVPTAKDILECLFTDADCGNMTFDDFCSEFSHSTDSIKAMSTYQACQSSGTKLRRALHSHYERVKTEIEKENES